MCKLATFANNVWPKLMKSSFPCSIFPSSLVICTNVSPPQPWYVCPLLGKINSINQMGSAVWSRLIDASHYCPAYPYTPKIRREIHLILWLAEENYWTVPETLLDIISHTQMKRRHLICGTSKNVCEWYELTKMILISKVHGANMGPTWVPLAPDGPHVGPMNFAIRDITQVQQ